MVIDARSAMTAEVLSALWDASLDGYHDAEAGETDGPGRMWFAVFRFGETAPILGGVDFIAFAGAILCVDNDGHKAADLYVDMANLDSAWRSIERSTATDNDDAGAL